MTDKQREAFEADAEPYGYDLTTGNETQQLLSGDVPFVYSDDATNARWLGWLSRQSEIDDLVEVMKHVRIMATEAYLDQDGKSIIAAADFKDIEQYLLVEIEKHKEDE